MSLFKFVDKILGSDFSGDKARKQIDQATAAGQAGNAAAAATMKQYGEEASRIYEKYVREGMDTFEAANKAATEAVNAGYEQAIATHRSGGAEALARLEQGYQQGEQTYQDMFQAGQDARQPYIQSGTQMLGAVPQLAAALGIPGAGNYDVTASPLYQWQMQQMDEQLANQLAAMGVGNDTVAAYIRSKNVGQLGAEERQRQIGDLQQMAGMGMQAASTFGMPEYQAAGELGSMGIGAGMNAANLMGQTTGNVANLQAQQGTNQADLLSQAAVNRGNSLTGLGQGLSQIQLGMGGNVGQSQIASGQMAMNAGLSKASMPNPVNQLINTGLQLYGMGAFGGGGSASPAAATTGGSVGRFSFNNMPRQYGL
jgi:hypothetical protein